MFSRVAHGPDSTALAEDCVARKLILICVDKHRQTRNDQHCNENANCGTSFCPSCYRAYRRNRQHDDVRNGILLKVCLRRAVGIKGSDKSRE